jgi:TolB-like protein
LAVIVAIAIGVRTANKSRVVGAQPIPQNPLRETAAIGARARTVAVLPFDNISADPADAYLAQGLPEMILNRLSRIDGLSIIARNSSFALPTKNIDSSEIGRRLNSGYLIGGSVQREADRLRVAVHLVDSAAGTLIWSAHFDRGLHDIFSIEDEIADQIADALSVRIGAGAPKPRPVPQCNLGLSHFCRVGPCSPLHVAESDAAVPYSGAIARLNSRPPTLIVRRKMQAADQRRENLRPVRQRYRRRTIGRWSWILPARTLRVPCGRGPMMGCDIDNPRSLRAPLRQGAALDPSNGVDLRRTPSFYFDLNGPRKPRAF